MNRTVSIYTTLSEVTCINCGIVYWLPEEFHNRRRKTHESYYCPNGHSQYYPAKSDEEILRAQLTESMSRESELSTELRRTKNRISKGVCPCCNRTFKNVGKHMSTKHPDY